MRHSEGVAALFVLACALTGCSRITTQVVEKPRVDQEIQGNRGYLMGQAPQSQAPRKMTRKIIQTDIELPTAAEMNPWKKEGRPQQVAQAAPAAPAVQPRPAISLPPPAREELIQREWEEEEEDTPPDLKGSTRRPAPATNVEPRETAAASTYTVQSGDTLDRISQKVYGSARHWRKIYEANQDKLKSPGRIYVGQKLRIPSLEPGQTNRASSSDYEEFK